MTDSLIDCWLLNVQQQIFHAYSWRQEKYTCAEIRDVTTTEPGNFRLQMNKYGEFGRDYNICIDQNPPTF